MFMHYMNSSTTPAILFNLSKIYTHVMRKLHSRRKKSKTNIKEDCILKNRELERESESNIVTDPTVNLTSVSLNF